MQNLLVLTDSTRVLCPGHFAKMQDSRALKQVKEIKKIFFSINTGGSRPSMSRYSGRHCQYQLSSRGKDAFLIKIKLCICVCVHVLTYSKMYVNDGKSCRKYSSKKKMQFSENNPKDLFITERSFTKQWVAWIYALFLFTSYLSTSLNTSSIKKKKNSYERDTPVCATLSSFHTATFQKEYFNLQ